MSTEPSTNVWHGPEDTANLKARVSLMRALKSHIDRAGWTQAQAAQAFHVTQPRISDLQRGKIALFSVDSLINMTAIAGMRVELRVLDAP